MNLAQVTALNEDEARDYLEGIRWPNGATCPHCGSKECKKLEGKSTRPGLYKCKSKECRKQFTVTVGTIFERSHISLRHWVIAFHLMCSSKKGISAHQLHRNLGITYKSAWFMCHRIRHALANGPFPDKLKGTVEVDETYVGGKSRHGSGRFGRGTGKTPVVALVQRNGNVRTRVLSRVTKKELRKEIMENVEQSATLMTDEYPSYISIGKEFARHGRIRHKSRKYAIGDVTTNTVESFFALLKRGHYGVFHHFGKQHLQRYCDEFSFRWNHRKSSDSARRDAALGMTAGKRLMYG